MNTVPIFLAPSRRRDPNHVRRGLVWGMLAPYLFFLLAFAIVPVAGALWASLGGFGARDPFGLGTFARAFSNLNFLPAVINVGTFILVMLPPLLIIATLGALILHARPGRFTTAIRLIFFIPGTVVGAPLVLLWLFMLTPQLSPFQPILNLLGFQSAAQVFTAPNLPVIFAIISIYAGVGGWIVVLYGSLDAIDTNIMEASRIDGANAVQQAWYIKLPLIRRYVAFIGILSFAGAAQLAAEPNLVGAAFPGTVSQAWSLNQLAFYYAFQQNDAAAAAAYGIFLVVVGLAAALVLIFGLKGYGSETESS